jgi:CheY-like chemotaxis protein
MASLKNSKILVCDDDETMLLLKEQLLEEGLDVICLRWKFALRIKRTNYDVLLLDLNMKYQERKF